jgi:hypothetical protein
MLHHNVRRSDFDREGFFASPSYSPEPPPTPRQLFGQIALVLAITGSLALLLGFRVDQPTALAVNANAPATTP